jgi:hypothetical protein
MTTVLAYESGGAKRRCDARCHNAVHDDCNCICDGKNHGVGFQQAIVNIQEDLDGLKEAGIVVKPFQLPLPTAQASDLVGIRSDIETRALIFGGIA